MATRNRRALDVQAEELCSVMIEALIANPGMLPSKVAQLDSLSWMLPAAGWWRTRRRMHLVLAEALERAGDLDAALAAIRRVSDAGEFYSTYLREEGRLAALTGDREGAIRAYDIYLRLRFDPEPSVMDEVNRVRAEFIQLLDESDVRKN